MSIRVSDEVKYKISQRFSKIITNNNLAKVLDFLVKKHLLLQGRLTIQGIQTLFAQNRKPIASFQQAACCQNKTGCISALNDLLNTLKMSFTHLEIVDTFSTINIAGNLNEALNPNNTRYDNKDEFIQLLIGCYKINLWQGWQNDEFISFCHALYNGIENKKSNSAKPNIVTKFQKMFADAKNNSDIVLALTTLRNSIANPCSAQSVTCPSTSLKKTVSFADKKSDTTFL